MSLLPINEEYHLLFTIVIMSDGKEMGNKCETIKIDFVDILFILRTVFWDDQELIIRMKSR